MRDNPTTILLVFAAMPLITYLAWLLYPFVRLLYNRIDKFTRKFEK